MIFIPNGVILFIVLYVYVYNYVIKVWYLFIVCWLLCMYILVCIMQIYNNIAGKPNGRKNLDFDVKLFLCFGIHLNNHGMVRSWIYQVLTILPALVISTTFYYFDNPTYELECGYNSNETGVFCNIENTDCCKVEGHTSFFGYINYLVSSMIAGYGIVRYMSIFILDSDKEAMRGAVISGDLWKLKRDFDKKFAKIKTALNIESSSEDIEKSSEDSEDNC